MPGEKTMPLSMVIMKQAISLLTVVNRLSSVGSKLEMSTTQSQ